MPKEKNTFNPHLERPHALEYRREWILSRDRLVPPVDSPGTGNQAKGGRSRRVRGSAEAAQVLI